MINIDSEQGILDIPDLGVTLRTMLGCAVTGYKSNPKRTWKLKYKGVVIGSVRIKTDGSLRVGSLKQFSKEPTCQM